MVLTLSRPDSGAGSTDRGLFGGSRIGAWTRRKDGNNFAIGDRCT